LFHIWLETADNFGSFGWNIQGCCLLYHVHICGGIDLASFYYLSIIFCNCSDCVVFLFFSFSTIKYKLMKPVITNVVNCHVLTLTQSSKPHRWCNGKCACLECGRSSVRGPVAVESNQRL
jgi:hypothetical protein